MEATIVLVYENPKQAKAVSEAVSPDNIKTPIGLSVKTIRKDNRVVTSIEYRDGNFMTFLSTIDDLLSCVSVAEKALLTTKENR